MESSLESFGEPAIDFLEHLRPSVTYKDMSENLQNVAVLPNDVSTSSQSGGLFSMTKVKPEKFTSENIQYCQHFLNYMPTVKAENINFTMNVVLI